VKTLKERILAVIAIVAGLILLQAGSASAQMDEVAVREAVQKGTIAPTVAALESAISSDPSYYLNYYLLGLVYYETERYARARDQFTLALDKRSKHYESLYYLGRSQLQLGELEEAEKAFKEGLKKAKDIQSWFENGYGLLAVASKDYGEADIRFRKALSANETDREKRLKDLTSAPMTPEEKEAEIARVTQRYAREDAEYHINLGDANFFQDVPALAIMEYERALEIDTAGTEVYFHWAEACLAIKDYNCALEKLGVVLRRDSTYAEAWHRAGGIYFKAALSSRQREERKSRFFDAIGAYRKYFQLTDIQPDSTTVRSFFETAMSYAEVSAFDSAAVFFDRVLAIPYVPKDIYFYYGKSLWGIRDYERSTDMLVKHLEWVVTQEDYSSRVRDVELYQLLGDGYFYRQPKDFYNAIKYYTKSLEEYPEQKRLLGNVAVSYHNRKEYANALEYYDQRIALGIDESSASIVKNAGLCALALAGKAAGGDEDDELMDELDGEDEGGGDLGFDPNVNYYEVAIGYMNTYLETVPGDTAVLLRIANTYLYQLSDCTNGVSSFERLLAVDPGNCIAKKSIGFAYFGGVCTKNYSKALPYLLDAYTCTTANGGACDDEALVKWIGQCYHLRAAEPDNKNASADYKKAHEWYGKVLKCNPNDSEIKKARDEISFEFN